MQDGPTSLIEALPPEILADVASYLEPAELENLRLVSRSFAALSEDAFDIAWQPHLKKLKEIDPSISLLPPEVPIRGWRQAQFKQHFVRIADQQMEEINHFKEHPQNGQATFAQITGPAKTLSEVLKREALLNQFNANLIKSMIEKNSTRLLLFRMGLTRFPKQLFEDDELVAYWPRLKCLDLTSNVIKFLPDALGHCTELQILSCPGNQLTALPDTLGNCTKLQMFICSGNHLRTLPDTLGNCTALQELNCADNQLAALPDTLCNCIALEWLECKNNKLTVLPPSLANCAVLGVLGLDGNFLKTIPPEIKARFAERWYEKTMSSQNKLRESSLLPDFLKESSKGMTKTQNYLKSLAKKCLIKLIEALKTPSQYPFTLGLMSATFSLGMGSICLAFGPSLLIKSLSIGALVTAAIKTKTYFASQTLQSTAQQPNALSEAPSFLARHSNYCYQLGKTCLESSFNPLMFRRMPANNQGNTTPDNSAPANNTLKP